MTEHIYTQIYAFMCTYVCEYTHTIELEAFNKLNWVIPTRHHVNLTSNGFFHKHFRH